MVTKPKNIIEVQPEREEPSSQSPMKLFMWIFGLPLVVIIVIMTLQNLL
jgi:hypothetical protein